MIRCHPRAAAHPQVASVPAASPVQPRCGRTGARRRSTAGSPRGRRRRGPGRVPRGGVRAGSRARAARSPARSQRCVALSPERSCDGHPGRLVREIVQLERIGLQVVEQIGVSRAADVLVAAAPDHHHRRRHAFGQVLAEHLGRSRGGARAARRRGSCPRSPRPPPARRRAPRAWGRGRAGTPARHTAGREARHARDQRDARRPLEERHLVPEAALAQELAVVGGEEHERRVREAGRRERVEQLADALVEVADRRVVAVARAAQLLGAERPVVEQAHVAQAQAVRIGFVARDRRDRREAERVARRRDPSSAAAAPRDRAGS